MGSVSFDGVSFRIYSEDHEPPHAHGYYGSTRTVVRLENPDSVGVRRGSTKPRNAKQSDVRKIVAMAVEHYSELMEIWEAIHG